PVDWTRMLRWGSLLRHRESNLLGDWTVMGSLSIRSQARRAAPEFAARRAPSRAHPRFVAVVRPTTPPVGRTATAVGPGLTTTRRPESTSRETDVQPEARATWRSATLRVA